MTRLCNNISRLIGCCLTVLVVMMLAATWFAPVASAAELLGRSLVVSSPLVSATATHTFTFTFPDNSLTGSIVFEYCTNPLSDTVCARPAGVDASGAVLQQQTGETGFVIEHKDANEIILSRPPVRVSNDTAQYVFSNIINPNGQPATFYVRILTYSTSDASGGNTDFGAVANSTIESVDINTQVPPYLEFCVGQSIPGDCSTAQGNFLQLGDLSTFTPARATSQLAAAGNPSTGLVITVNGPPLTSGNNVISALSHPTASVAGTSQFGINLRSNTVPLVGSDPTGPGTITPATGYDSPNQFKLGDGDVVASTTGATDFSTLTVSYLVNISPSQAIGVYDTTLTYICTASF